MPLHRLRVALVLALVLAAGCTSARLRRETAAGLRDADALAARGCHACLVDALAIYQRLTPRDPTLRAQVDRRVFRTSLLLALREKEIGLSAQAHLDRARRFADADGTAADRERLDLADRLPWVATGQVREVSMQQSQRLSALNDRIVARLTRAPLAGSDDPELDAYLDLSCFCTGRFRIEPARTLASFIPPGKSSPLLEYRAGACNVTEHASLDAVLAAEPRFVETVFFIGRVKRDMSMRGALRAVNREAVDAFTRAHQAFPDSAAITMEMAGMVRVRSPRDALPLYDDVVARVPGLHEAWFGKGLCESYMGRHDAAVATLTHLIDMGQWLTGDALYWRAWNRHQLKQLETAQQDVERAKTLLYNTELFALAGIIAHDRQQFDAARTDLLRALEISSRNCAAAWYLGLTNAAQERWAPSGSAFEQAGACYLLDADDARRSLTQAEALEESDGRVEQIASARAALEESLRQEALSAYNAGYGLVRAQDTARARPLLERARQHADVRARADELLTWLDRPARE
jgi:tetratricopeptide (TPR) repeat protein